MKGVKKKEDDGKIFFPSSAIKIWEETKDIGEISAEIGRLYSSFFLWQQEAKEIGRIGFDQEKREEKGEREREIKRGNCE